MVCWHDLEFAFVAKEVSFMLDTALRKVSEVGSYTCALDNVEDVPKFMQIRFLGQCEQGVSLRGRNAKALFVGTSLSGDESDETTQRPHWTAKPQPSRASEPSGAFSLMKQAPRTAYKIG